jgi:hypothetical protein
MKKIAAYTGCVVLVISLVVFTVFNHKEPVAQSRDEIRDFMDAPWIPVVTEAPDNVHTRATQTLNYSGQPAAADTLTISGPGSQTEVFEFYANGGTYTGSNIGVEKNTTEDGTYNTLATVISANSLFVDASNNTGSNVTTLTAQGNTYRGERGNDIDLAESIANATLTGTSLAGGVSVSRGNAGELRYVNGATDYTDQLWIKTSDARYTSGVWELVVGLATSLKWAGVGTGVASDNDTSEAITVTGALPGDYGFAQISSGGKTAGGVWKTTVTTDTVTAFFTDPDTTTTVINAIVVRPGS